MFSCVVLSTFLLVVPGRILCFTLHALEYPCLDCSHGEKTRQIFNTVIGINFSRTWAILNLNANCNGKYMHPHACFAYKMPIHTTWNNSRHNNGLNNIIHPLQLLYCASYLPGTIQNPGADVYTMWLVLLVSNAILFQLPKVSLCAPDCIQHSETCFKLLAF